MILNNRFKPLLILFLAVLTTSTAATAFPLKPALLAVFATGTVHEEAEIYLIKDSVNRGFDWYDTWLGLINVNQWPWIFHENLGWVYAGADGNNDDGGWYYAMNKPLEAWFWASKPGSGWLYTGPEGQAPAWWYLSNKHNRKESIFHLLHLDGSSVLSAEDAWVRAQTPELPTAHTYRHPIAPRLQWNENSGYCGETSFISAGLHFGQYCSQYTARAIASPGKNQTHPNSQLLLGVNDMAAAQRMRLQANAFYYETQVSTENFLAWVKSNTLKGSVVIIGVFNNGILLGEWSGREDGDPEYDHIVPVLAIGSDYPFNQHAGAYLPNDVITISDNGLYGPNGTPPEYQFLYSSFFDIFMGDRFQANNPRGPLYLLKDQPKTYGIAIEGVMDFDEVTIPVQLVSSLNHEPEIGHHSDVPPEPIPFTLTVTVHIPDTSKAYHLYRYDDFSQIPVQDFNTRADQAKQVWHIPAHHGETYTLTWDALTDQTVIFRAVPVDAP